MPKKKSMGRSKKKKTTSSRKKTTKSTSRRTSKADKVNYYADKLYRGLIKLYREKEKQDIFSLSLSKSNAVFSPERKNPPKQVRDFIIDKYNGKCAVCGKGFDAAYTTLQFHHVNGNRGETNEKNLIPVHAGCHIRIHKLASAKFWLYKQRKEKSKGTRSPLTLSGSKGRRGSIWDLPMIDKSGSGKKKKRKKSESIWDMDPI